MACRSACFDACYVLHPVCIWFPAFRAKRAKRGPAGAVSGAETARRRGRFRGFCGPRKTRGGGRPLPKTLAPEGLLRVFVGPTRRRRTTPAGAFPRRALFSQSDLGVCKTGGGNDPGADQVLYVGPTFRIPSGFPHNLLIISMMRFLKSRESRASVTGSTLVALPYRIPQNRPKTEQHLESHRHRGRVTTVLHFRDETLRRCPLFAFLNTGNSLFFKEKPISFSPSMPETVTVAV